MSSSEGRIGCPRDASGRFTNPWASWKEHSWWELIWHFFTARGARMTAAIAAQIPVLDPDFARRGSAGIRATWLGHATFYVDMGVRVLTDPVFEHPIGPWFWPIRRIRPAPCPVAALPPVDVVTISHDHFDHYNPEDLLELLRYQPDVVFVVPRGMKTVISAIGVPAENVHEFDWWEEKTLGETTITFVPAQHWSGRSFFRNQTLWGGWVVQHAGACVYHAGDTGYCPVFAEIGARFAIDLAMIPIGACEPRHFMRPHHIDAEDAVDVHRDVRAKRSVAMHHSTFVLSSTEPILGPRDSLAALVDPAEFCCVLPGESIEINTN